jgi:hypothetical protein
VFSDIERRAIKGIYKEINVSNLTHPSIKSTALPNKIRFLEWMTSIMNTSERESTNEMHITH